MDNNSLKKQNRSVTVFAIILSVVSIGLLIFGFKVVSSDKVVMLQSISNLVGKFESVIEQDFELLNQISSQSNIKLDSNIQITTESDKFSFDMNYIENSDDKKSSAEISLFNEDEELVNASLALNNNKIYLFIKNITANFYYTDMDYISVFSKMKQDDIENITTYLKESIIDYVSDKDISKKKKTITYKGKDKSVNQLTYSVSRKKLKEIAEVFIKKISNNKEMLKRMGLTYNLTSDQVNEKLKEFVSSLDYTENDILFDYVIYYYGFNKIVQYEIVIDDSVFSYSEDKLMFLQDENKISVDIKNNKDNKELDVEIDMNGEKSSFYVIINENNVKIDIKKDKGISYTFDYNFETIKNDGSYDVKQKLEVLEKNGDSNKILLTVDSINKYSFGAMITDNLQGAIDITDISDEEFSAMLEKVLEHPLVKYIEQIINNFSSNVI